MNYQQQWNSLYEQQHKLIWEAKHFIQDNVEKVTNWSKFTLYIQNQNHIDSGNTLRYGFYGKKLKFGEVSSQAQLGFITTLTTDLDESDGDLSLTITTEEGTKEWWWVKPEAVISLAHYIEKQLLE